MKWILSLLLLLGCHARFKREAPLLGAVRTQVVNTGSPSVQLGYTDGSSLVGAIVNVVQAVNAINQTDRIANAVQIPDVDAALVQGVADTLGSGPPFAATLAPEAPLLQLEMLDYGVYVPYLGAPGVFTFDVRTRIYRPGGERVYRARTECSIGLGDPEAAAIVFGVVNNLGALKDMTDAQINSSFVRVGSWCGEEIVRKMRKHAG